MKKPIQIPRKVLAEVRRVLAASKPRVGSVEPLRQVEKTVRDGRQLGAVTIRLGDAERAGEIAVPIFLGTQTLGVLSVAKGSRNGPIDRILLKHVARELALFLRGRGKYLMREARGRAAEAPVLPRREPQPEHEAVGLRAAAGDVVCS